MGAPYAGSFAQYADEMRRQAIANHQAGATRRLAITEGRDMNSLRAALADADRHRPQVAMHVEPKKQGRRKPIFQGEDAFEIALIALVLIFGIFAIMKGL